MTETPEQTFTIEGLKYAYRQTKDGHVVSFVIHPNDVSLDLTNAPIGQRFELVLRQLSETE